MSGAAIGSEFFERPVGVEEQALHVGLERLELRQVREQIGMRCAVGTFDNQDDSLVDRLASNLEPVAVAGEHPVGAHGEIIGNLGPQRRGGRPKVCSDGQLRAGTSAGDPS